MVEQVLLICAFITLVAVIVAGYVTIIGFYIWQVNHKILALEVEKFPDKLQKAVEEYVQPYKEALEKDKPVLDNVQPLRSNDEIANDENESRYDQWVNSSY